MITVNSPEKPLTRQQRMLLGSIVLDEGTVLFSKIKEPPEGHSGYAVVRGKQIVAATRHYERAERLQNAAGGLTIITPLDEAIRRGYQPAKNVPRR